MYISFELDGIISTPIKSLTDIESILKQTPIDEAKDMLTEIRTQGHQIIIYTKRDASTAIETEAWLSKHKIPYDQLIFGRPRAISIFFAKDTRQFISWKNVKNELIKYGFLKETKVSNQINLSLPSNPGSIQDLKNETK